MKKTGNKWGFDARELDESVRPQDDFYRYVNAKWMAANPIPANESRWGSFVKLRYDVDQKLQAILKELDGTRSLPHGTPEQMIRDFYRSGMDMKRRNQLGMRPIETLLVLVRNIRDTSSLLTTIAKLHRIGVNVAWGAGLDQDAKNSERYLLHFVQGGLGMPEREYYLKEDAEPLRVRTAYHLYVEKLFRLMGRTAAQAARDRDVVLKVETALARASMKKEDVHDVEKTYHKMSVTKLSTHAPQVDWARYLTLIGTPKTKEVIVMQPDFFTAVAKMTETVSIVDWKVYFEWHVVNDFASLLSAPFIRTQFAFYGTALSGTKVMKPLWRRVLGVVSGEIGELLGRIYAQRHFGPEAKRKMNLIVDDLFAAYESRIKALDWMGPATKKKALQKLRAFNRKIGYPDKWKSYTGLVIKADDYVGNVLRTNEHEHKRAMKKLHGPIDRAEWFMHPHTVNAYHHPSLNDIAFPAAILQPPYFSVDNDDGVNYGGIGAVIGHEITHGFDDDGAKFDYKGNLKGWWTPEDKKRFEAKTKKVVKQFDRYTVADGVKVNGKLTIGENIADLGGLSIAYDAYQMQLARTGRKDIDGLTPEQRFFISFAVFERENIRPEMEKTYTLIDTHSPGIFRINGPVSNFAPFYEAYGVKNGDTLYRPSSEREMVW